MGEEYFAVLWSIKQQSHVEQSHDQGQGVPGSQSSVIELGMGGPELFALASRFTFSVQAVVFN
jgi:hypothetical protein